MPTALILSSFVAASPVGGGAQAQVLARMGVDTILAPTVLYGRHPGLGAPGGGTVSARKFESLIEGIEGAEAFAAVDAMITGYFASPRQVAAAVRVIERARPAWLVVDPIMGDAETGLYVSEAVAAAIEAQLIPHADLIAPNAWELARLAGQAVSDAASALIAARSLGKPALVSSLEADGDIGVLYADADEAWLAAHPRHADAPKGTGDILTAHFVGAVLGGLAPREAMFEAVCDVAVRLGGRAVDVRVTPQ